MSTEIHFDIEEEYIGQRVDKALSVLCTEFSRSRIQALIAKGEVTLNGDVLTSASRKVAEGDKITMNVPEPEPCEPQAEDIPLDVVYEDDHLLVLNKAAGLVVHPGAGNWSGTLVNALLHHCGDSLSGIGGVIRPGIVHRLDKSTSGLMVVAKSDAAHQGLAGQLADRSLSRDYVALVTGVPTPLKGAIDQAINRDHKNRLKMAVVREGGREARTFYHVKQNFGDACSLVHCKLESGRTHQIRVHMEWLGYPLVGDPLYGPQPTKLRSMLKKSDYGEAVQAEFLKFPRQALHARALSFIHPIDKEPRSFEVDIPDDFSNLLKLLDI